MSFLVVALTALGCIGALAYITRPSTNPRPLVRRPNSPPVHEEALAEDLAFELDRAFRRAHNGRAMTVYDDAEQSCA